MTLFPPLENRAPRPRSAVRLWAVGVLLLAGVLPAMAQLPALPAVPVGVPAVPGGAAGAGKSIWQFLGFKGGARFKRLRDALVNRRGNFPGLEKKPRIKSLTDPDNLASDNPAIKEAAKAKSDADAAPQKIKAIKYLATVGCASNGCNPGIKGALLAALDDCIEEVRFEAAKAFLKAAGEKCDPCRQSCCDKEVTDKFFKIAYDRDEKGCFVEASPRVRKAARQVLCVCCQPGPGTPVPPVTKEGPQGEELDVPKQGPGGPAAATAHNQGVSPFSPAVVRSMFVPRSIADALPATPAMTAPSATPAPPVRSTTVQTPPVAVPAPAQQPRVEEEDYDAPTSSIAGFLDPRIRRSELPRRVMTTMPSESEPRSAAETSAAIEQAAAVQSTNKHAEEVQNTRYDEPVGASHEGKILLAGNEDLGEYDVNMSSQMRRALAERFGFNSMSMGKPDPKAAKKAPPASGATPGPTSWSRTTPNTGRSSFGPATSPTVPEAIRDIAVSSQPPVNTMLPEAHVNTNPSGRPGMPPNRPLRDPATFARMNPPTGYQQPGSQQPNYQQPAYQQPGYPQPGMNPAGPPLNAGYPPAGQPAQPPQQPAPPALAAENPPANYPPAYPPAGYPGTQPAAQPAGPQGYPPAGPAGYPGSNPVAVAPPAERPAPARQPAHEVWAPDYQVTPAPPPEPIAALNPPEATVKFGAARPLVRYGEVKPLVRYGSVQAIAEGQTEPAPVVEEQPATEEELDALFPPSVRSTRKPGPGAWAEVYLFRKPPEFSSHVVPATAVEPYSQQPPPAAAPPSEGRTAELEGTIYRR